jgi:hypothetical protein
MENGDMPIVNRVEIFVDGKLIETKDFTNRIAADQYADQRYRELDRGPGSVRTNVEPVQTY